MERPPSPQDLECPISPEDYHDSAEGDEDDKTPPPLPPTASAVQPSYEAPGQHQYPLPNHDQHRKDVESDNEDGEGQLLDDIFPRPPPRDIAAAAVMAANSALGNTSPVTDFDTLGAQALKGLELDGDEDEEEMEDEDEEEDDLADSGGEYQNETLTSSSLPLNDGGGEDGLVGTTPTTAQARSQLANGITYGGANTPLLAPSSSFSSSFAHGGVGADSPEGGVRFDVGVVGDVGGEQGLLNGHDRYTSGLSSPTMRMSPPAGMEGLGFDAPLTAPADYLAADRSFDADDDDDDDDDGDNDDGDNDDDDDDNNNDDDDDRNLLRSGSGTNGAGSVGFSGRELAAAAAASSVATPSPPLQHSNEKQRHERRHSRGVSSEDGEEAEEGASSEDEEQQDDRHKGGRSGGVVGAPALAESPVPPRLTPGGSSATASIATTPVGSTLKQRMGTAPGERSPFDDDGSDYDDEGDAADGADKNRDDGDGDDGDGELTEEQRKFARELGMFGEAESLGSALASPAALNAKFSAAGDTFDSHGDGHDGQVGERKGNAATNEANKHKKQQQQQQRFAPSSGEVPTDDAAADASSAADAAFHVRSWSGHRRFQHTWDEGAVGMLHPEFANASALPGGAGGEGAGSEAETAAAAASFAAVGDRWRSPVKEAKGAKGGKKKKAATKVGAGAGEDDEEDEVVEDKSVHVSDGRADTDDEGSGSDLEVEDEDEEAERVRKSMDAAASVSFTEEFLVRGGLHKNNEEEENDEDEDGVEACVEEDEDERGLGADLLGFNSGEGRQHPSVSPISSPRHPRRALKDSTNTASKTNNVKQKQKKSKENGYNNDVGVVDDNDAGYDYNDDGEEAESEGKGRRDEEKDSPQQKQQRRQKRQQKQRRLQQQQQQQQQEQQRQKQESARRKHESESEDDDNTYGDSDGGGDEESERRYFNDDDNERRHFNDDDNEDEGEDEDNDLMAQREIEEEENTRLSGGDGRRGGVERGNGQHPPRHRRRRSYPSRSDDDDTGDNEDDDDDDSRNNNGNGAQAMLGNDDAVTERAKAMLSALGDQKRKEKEAAERKAKKLEERKRRKNEELLERARLRRMLPKHGVDGGGEAAEGPHQGGVGGEVLASASPPVKKKGGGKPEAVALTLEQAAVLAAEEEERVARVGSLRRAFKHKHKTHLVELTEKRRKDEEAKVELAGQEEARLKHIKEQGVRRAKLRRRREQQEKQLEEEAEAGGGGSAVSGGKGSPSPSSSSSDLTPRGSGVAAVRAANASSSANKSGSAGEAEGALEGGEVGEAEEKANRYRKAMAMKAAVAKQQGLLKQMAEDAKAKKEAGAQQKIRLEKRAALKRDRILQAAQQRKQQHKEAQGDEEAEEAEEFAAAQAADAATAAGAAKAKRNKGKRQALKGGGGDKGEANPKKPQQPSSALLSSAAMTASVSRLYTTKTKSSEVGGKVEARDFEDWKRKHGVPLEGKVFSLTGWYPCVKEALLSRGWHFNEDRESFFFDLKWTLRSNELKQEQLQPFQRTNHFLKNTAITTKVGLLKSLKQLEWHVPLSSHAIYPRSYDLNNGDEMQAFLDDYRTTAAQGLLKEVVARCCPQGSPKDLDCDAGVLVNGGALDVALQVCKRCAFPKLDSDEYLDEWKLALHSPVSEIEWEVLGYASKQGRYEAAPELAASNKGGGEEEGGDAEKRGDSKKKARKGPAPPPPLPRPVFRSWDSSALLSAGKPPKPLDGFLRAGQAAALGREDPALGDQPLLPSSGAGAAGGALQKGGGGKGGGSGGGQQQMGPMERQAAEREQRKRHEHDEALRRKFKAQCCGSLVAVGLPRLTEAVHTLRALNEKEGGVNEKEAAAGGSQQQEGGGAVQQPSLALSAGGGDVVGGGHFGGSQAALNGRFATKNLWIVKPSAKSRGRGIRTFRDIDKLLEYVGVGETGQSSTLWVVQKYMENPYIIAKRKFDIRQWVLVTDWNPLTVYFYDECYARFSAEPYSDDDAQLLNEHVHLVNNSVAKHSDKFHDKVVAENGVEVKDCMWSLDQLKAHMTCSAKQRGLFKGHDAKAKLTHKRDKALEQGHESAAEGYAAQLAALPPVDQGEGEDVFGTRCHGRMREIAKCALLCAQGQVEHRHNSWELYGYDYMIDDDFNPWLIEINSSPACDYSTEVTEDFVPRALTDVVKVVVDLREWEEERVKAARRGGGGQGKKGVGGEEGLGGLPPKPDIGGWEPLYKGQFLEVQRTALGLDLACVGSGLMERNGRPKPGLKVNSRPHPQPVPNLYDDENEGGDKGGVQGKDRRGKGGSTDDDDDDDSNGGRRRRGTIKKANKPSGKKGGLKEAVATKKMQASDDEDDEDSEDDEDDEDDDDNHVNHKLAPRNSSSSSSSSNSATTGKQPPFWSNNALVRKSPRLSETDEKGDIFDRKSSSDATSPNHDGPSALAPPSNQKVASDPEPEVPAVGAGLSGSIDFDDI